MNKLLSIALLTLSSSAAVFASDNAPGDTELDQDLASSVYLASNAPAGDSVFGSDPMLDPADYRLDPRQRVFHSDAADHTVALYAQANQEQQPAGGGNAQQGQGAANTGNDPRDFATKFMPYYRYTELKNGTTMDSVAIFGLWALTKNFAITYETPLGMQVDITDTEQCAGLPEVDCTGSVPGFRTLPNGLPAEGDGVETGMGDTTLRFLFDTKTNFLGGAFLPGFQLVVPTATETLLGSEAVTGGPILTGVWDVKKWPAPGAFFAAMNIFEVDFYKENGREDTGRYMGRWFLQLPVNKKHKLYILTEFQPVWDWEADHFSFWMGPEFGKAFAPNKGILRNGGAIYFKPGFGIGADANSGDRDWTFEVGFRAFFPAGPDAFDKISSMR